MARQASRRTVLCLLTAILLACFGVLIGHRLSSGIPRQSHAAFNLTLARHLATHKAATQGRGEDRCAPLPFHPSPNASLFPCAWRSSIPPLCSRRLRARLVCNETSADIVYDWVHVDTPPAAYSLHDACLERVVKTRCHQGGQEGQVIPNLSHHVFFGGKELKDYTFLSVISAVRSVQPCLVLVHADRLPAGKYWAGLVRLLPHLVHVNRSAPSSIFGHQVKVIEHSSDIARLEAVKKLGGVYLDSDYLLFRAVAELRRHSVVMGETIPHVNYANGIFMGQAEAPFLQAWYQAYTSFNDSQWGFHSTILPYRLHQARPDLALHVVSTFMQPYFADIRQRFFDKELDWRRLHGLHLYVRLFPKYFVGSFELGQVGTLGQVCRHLLFGDSRACLANVSSASSATQAIGRTV